jgi:hypothetical protein
VVGWTYIASLISKTGHVGLAIVGHITPPMDIDAGAALVPPRTGLVANNAPHHPRPHPRGRAGMCHVPYQVAPWHVAKDVVAAAVLMEQLAA